MVLILRNRQRMDIFRIMTLRQFTRAALSAVLLTVASACSKVDTAQEVTLQEKPVTFSAFTEKMTKGTAGEITSTQRLAAAGGFYVWGYNTKTANKDWANAKTVFNGTAVTSTTGDFVDTDSTTWTYSPIKYWNKSATYCFYAAAPAGNNNITYSISGNGDQKMISVTGVQPAKASESLDILIARGGVKDIDGGNMANIDFTFQHIMAKVKVRLKLADSFKADSLVVTKLEMTGFDPDKGNFTQKYDSVSGGKEKEEWEFATSATQEGYAYFVGNKAKDKTIKFYTENKDSVCQDSYIMIPQEFSENQLKINASFTIYYQDNTSDIFIVPAEIPMAHIWATNSVTTYTISLSPVAIKVDASSTAWDTGDNKTIEIN